MKVNLDRMFSISALLVSVLAIAFAWGSTGVGIEGGMNFGQLLQSLVTLSVPVLVYYMFGKDDAMEKRIAQLYTDELDSVSRDLRELHIITSGKLYRFNEDEFKNFLVSITGLIGHAIRSYKYIELLATKTGSSTIESRAQSARSAAEKILKDSSVVAKFKDAISFLSEPESKAKDLAIWNRSLAHVIAYSWYVLAAIKIKHDELRSAVLGVDITFEDDVTVMSAEEFDYTNS